jgi:2-dehydro-3-deoxyglucarate aldolase/4-hydroxy-2-oxoheptanedioate aldolase
VLDEKRDLILAAAKKYGKTCSMLVTSAEQARQWKEAGALLLVYLSDVEMLHSGFSRAMASIRGG